VKLFRYNFFLTYKTPNAGAWAAVGVLSYMLCFTLRAANWSTPEKRFRTEKQLSKTI